MTETAAAAPVPRRPRLRMRLFRQALIVVAAVGLGLVLTGSASTSRVLFRFGDPRIDESSGLAIRGGLVLTVNDSGDTGRVFLVDPSSGRTVGVTTYSASSPRDVEAVAVGRDAVWVGDIGDNNRLRDHITVYRLPPLQPGDRTVTAQSFDLKYADGPRDAETLLVSPISGQLFVVSKGLLGGTVYAAPTRLRAGVTNVLTPVGDAGSIITDGAFFPDGAHVVLRSYDKATVLDSQFRAVGDVDLPAQPQGEGIAVKDPGTVLISSEGPRSAVHEVTLPDDVLAAMQPTTSPSPTEEPSSAADATTTADAEQAQNSFWGSEGLRFLVGAGWVVVLVLLVRGWVRSRTARGARPRSRRSR